MNVLFIGGTGRLSTDVAKLALEKGNNVWLLTRGSVSRKKFVDSKYKMIYSDIRNVKECKKALDGKKFDVVIDFLTFNVEQLHNTLNILGDSFFQYVFISSATVYEKSFDEEIITENTKIGNKKWNYAYEKYKCELELKKIFSNELKKKYTIIRPYVTYNETRIPYPIIPQNNFYEYSIIYRIKNAKSVPIINNDLISTTITNTKDFSKGVVGLFKNELAYGEAFHITSEEYITWGKVLDVISEYYGKEIKKVNFSVDEFSKKYSDFKNILNGDKGSTMRFDNTKIRKAVPDFSCEVSLKEGLYKSIEFLENNIEFQNIDFYWYGKLDKLCNDKKETKFPNKSEKIKYFCGYCNLPVFLYKFFKKVGIVK